MDKSEQYIYAIESRGKFLCTEIANSDEEAFDIACELYPVNRGELKIRDKKPYISEVEVIHSKLCDRCGRFLIPADDFFIGFDQMHFCGNCGYFVGCREA